MSHSAIVKLTESTLTISRRVSETGLGEAIADEGESILADVAEYVTALTFFFMAADGDLAEEESELVRSYLSSVSCLNIELPQRNHVEWAEKVLGVTPLFLQVAISHDKEENDHITSVIMWHIRHVICTIIGVDGHFSEAELAEARIYLKSQENLLASEFIDWSYDILDSPTEVLQKLCESPEKQESKDHTPDDLEACLHDLNALVGLDGVKQEVTTLVNLMKVRQLRATRGLKMPDMSLHMVFSGNPGTGKTTVARLLGRIYKALGVLPNGHVVEVDRAGIVAGYVGQTALKTKEALQKAHGGILFIDEAYTLINGKENDFGQEAIDTVLKYMEDNRDKIVIIVAGYNDQMQSFVQSNPGLQSRFNKFIKFGDYSVEELYSIFLKMIESNQYYYNEQVAQIVYDGLTEVKTRETLNFANARTVRNVFESIIQQQANRIANQDHGEDNDTIHLIEEPDVISAFAERGRI